MKGDLRRYVAPTGAVGLVLIGLGIAAPEIYTGTFSDFGTFLRVAGVVVALALWAVVVARLVRQPMLARMMIAAPILVVGWVALWPYLRPPTEVDEAFPPVESIADAETTTTTESTTTEPSPTTPTTTAPAEPGTAPPESTITPSTTATTTPSTTTTTTTEPAEPVELRRAGFQGLTGHRGSGDAAVYDLGAGSILLRFEDVDIGSGPDLDVYLVPGADQRGLGGASYVAPLTAERGNQNYSVPSGIDLTTGTWTVLVWCETFDVEVANATLV